MRVKLMNKDAAICPSVMTEMFKHRKSYIITCFRSHSHLTRIMASEQAQNNLSDVDHDILSNLANELWTTKRLVIVVGSGVTLSATADDSQHPLPRLRWRGMIRSGLDWLIKYTGIEASNVRIKRAYSALEDTDMESLLDAVNIFASLLEKEQDRGTWLNDIFHNLHREVRHPAILDVLCALHKEGAKLLTTNYDHLLEDHCNLRAISPSDHPNDIKKFKSGDLNGVFHLHGSYTRPSDVVLDMTDYYRVTNSEVREILGTFLKFNTVIFVGCGSGLEDPNFGPLLTWMREYQKDMAKSHCVLVPNEDVLSYSPLRKLKYGPSYSDLPRYLRRILDPLSHLRLRLFKEFHPTSVLRGGANIRAIQERWKHNERPKDSTNWLGGMYHSRFPPPDGNSTIQVAISIDHHECSVRWNITVPPYNPFYPGRHHGVLEIPEKYPLQKPVIKWDSSIYSPFTSGGRVSSPFDLGFWSPYYTILIVLQTMANILASHPLCEAKPYENWPSDTPWEFHNVASNNLTEDKVAQQGDKIILAANFFCRSYNRINDERQTNPQIDMQHRDASIAAISAIAEVHELPIKLEDINAAFSVDMTNDQWIRTEKDWADHILDEYNMRLT